MRDLEDEIRGTGVTLMGIGSLTDVSCTAASFVVYLWWQVKCYLRQHIVPKQFNHLEYLL